MALLPHHLRRQHHRHRCVLRRWPEERSRAETSKAYLLEHLTTIGVSADRVQERKAVLEASPTERIQHLEISRKKLVQQSNELQRKIDSLDSGIPIVSEDRGRQRGR